jgi:beta-glucosidase-like glycosyl hydrolase
MKPTRPHNQRTAWARSFPVLLLSLSALAACNKTETVLATCGATYPTGLCDAGQTCFQGACVSSSSLCSPTNGAGTCASGTTCLAGGCVLSSSLCSTSNAAGLCDAGKTCSSGACVANATLCSAANTAGACPSGWSCYQGGCIPAASVPQPCSPTVLNGTCAAAQICVEGTCLATATVCSPANPTGVCPANWSCYNGGCVVTNPVVDDHCDVKVNTVQPTLKFASDFITTNNGLPTGAAGASYTYDDDANAATPPVPVPWVKKSAITVDGLQFRDLNGNGTLEKYEDWRYSPLCRAKDLAARMAVKDKVGLMSEASSVGSGTSDGVLAQTTIDSLFVERRRQALIRHSDAISPGQLAAYMNNIQALSEGSTWGIPFVATEDPVHFVTQSSAVSGSQFIAVTADVSNWPNPMGLGAINDATVSFAYGNAVREDSMGLGIRWQLGPMLDTATEPRWYRWQTTLGETAPGVAKHGAQIILGFQNGKNGLASGIAATMKHFPGHGPEQGGRDAHQPFGKWLVYPGNNFDYHLQPFIAGINAGAAAVMPCYGIERGILEWNPEQVATAFSHGMVTRLLKETLGFDGLVTADWGILCAAGIACADHGVEALTVPERAAMFVKAGAHQLGNDSLIWIQAAVDMGLLTEADLTPAVTKILEMSFKLGIFENPYTDAALTAKNRSPANMQLGFDAQKKAIVLLRNAATGAGRLPISQSRYTDVAGGTAGAPDLGEFASDSNKNGKIEVYYDGIVDALHGSDRYSTAPINLMPDYDYRAPGSGTAGAAGFTLPIVEAPSSTTADIAVLRITSRGSGPFNIDAGIPLSFDGPYVGAATDGQRASAVKDAQKVIDLFRVRDGFKRADGTVVPAANPTLKIILVMYVDRPGIVKPFVHGLTNLDERAGCSYTNGTAALELCYPLVSDESNVNQTIVTATTATAHAGVDTFLVDFGAYDRALLDFLFNKNVPTTPAGYAYGAARLPGELPSTDAAVAAQLEDVPADSYQPTFRIGAGVALPAQ